MRTRLPAALLLLLSTLFLAGGTTPPASGTPTVHAKSFRAADHQQILPDPSRPQAHAGKGVHAASGGVAVLTARTPYGRQAHLAAVTDARRRAQGAGHHRRAPARAPPASPSLTESL
ncbi:hypothetical protein [Nonomuraea africana]|uniref:Secreted protein n=1 Tax=Nonomuraea africana TaxID=46171 RepID=A0ABR9KPK3_9ACTN|nr:hypothetical protein [Nonomuraea africana]MBE1563700.1 hypothetical protein [Nonomuraea africana]